MDDLISRQDVLKLIERWRFDLEMSGDRMLMERVIKAMPSAQPEQRWIPCKERLPLIDEYGYSDKMLVSFDKFLGVEICEYRVIDGSGRWYAGDTDDSPEDIGLRVTAYMPLPEPYREGEKDVDCDM